MLTTVGLWYRWIIPHTTVSYVLLSEGEGVEFKACGYSEL